MTLRVNGGHSKKLGGYKLDIHHISAISWRPALVVEEAGLPGENHRQWASNL
jgi:hypothetical protein